MRWRCTPEAPGAVHLGGPFDEVKGMIECVNAIMTLAYLALPLASIRHTYAS